VKKIAQIFSTVTNFLLPSPEHICNPLLLRSYLLTYLRTADMTSPWAHQI